MSCKRKINDRLVITVFYNTRNAYSVALTLRAWNWATAALRHAWLPMAHKTGAI